jgi:hypothetical protein
MIKQHKTRGRLWLAGLASALLCLGTAAQANITDGLVAWWHFDDNSFNDAVGIFDGEEQGALPIEFVDGKAGFGKAIKLDGEDQYILITGGEPDDLAFAGGSMSVAGWFKVDAFDRSWQALIAKGEGTNWRVHRRGDTDNLTASMGVAEAAQGGPPVNDGEWHHFVAIADAASFMSLYIDGELAEESTAPPVLAANGQRMRIADNPGAVGRVWEGELDDLAIWDRPLTEAEVAQLWNNGVGRPLRELFPVGEPPSIVTQPEPVTIVEMESAFFSVEVAGSPPFSYQWTKNGAPLTDGPGVRGAATRNLQLVDVPVSDNNAQIAVTVSGAAGAPVTSTAVTLTVLADTFPPTLARALGAADRLAVTVRFSERIQEASATTVANYQISGGVNVTAVEMVNDTTVLLTTSLHAENTQYTITVNNVQDLAGNTIAAGSTIVFNSAAFLAGVVQWERWNTPGGIDAFITAYGAGEMGPPDVKWATGLFESGRDLGDNYRARGYAWFSPPQTGNYRFIITADDNARFFLSTDDNPVNRRVTAAEGSWSNFREWSNATEEQDSATWITPLGGAFGEPEWDDFPIPLQAGQTYYMEAFWQEGGGGDGCEVTWTFFGDPRPANGTVSALSGERVFGWVDPTVLPPVISSPAANTAVTVAGGATQTLSVVATGAITYQWQRNGVDIPGATSADYVIANANATHSGQYWCFVSNENETARSPLINVLVTATGVFNIEAEDFDYDGGQSLPEASVMPYLGGAYAGLSAIHGVDYLSNDAADSPQYRGGAVLEAGTAAPMAQEGPGSQFSMTRMGEWEMTTNYKIGWIGAGDWGNYTRTFPTPAQNYWVFVASSYDGTAANQISHNLGIVTAGVGTAAQTVEPLGIFRAPGTAGWSRNNLVALTDNAGAIKTVQIGGPNTIRWSYDSGDADYLVFVPATVPDQPGAAQIAISANNVVISEDPPGASTVQSAPAITGPWTNVGASPQTVPIEGGTRYFRLTR